VAQRRGAWGSGCRWVRFFFFFLNIFSVKFNTTEPNPSPKKQQQQQQQQQQKQQQQQQQQSSRYARGCSWWWGPDRTAGIVAELDDCKEAGLGTRGDARRKIAERKVKHVEAEIAAPACVQENSVR
jgi:hypothetical protein